MSQQSDTVHDLPLRTNSRHVKHGETQATVAARRQRPAGGPQRHKCTKEEEAASVGSVGSLIQYLGCRKRKIKCDGIRPCCYACTASSTPCVYPVPEGLSQRQAQKQKLSHVSRAHENSQRVLELLRASRDGASQDILKQLQHSEHLDEAIQSIADASLLLPKIYNQSGGSANLSRQPGDSNRESTSRTQQQTKDQSAGNADSDHVLPVSCWTVVSQDNKLLTYLVDMFWTWDGTLSHLIDRELFIGDLSAAGPNFSAGQQRGFCSPFLVNTILAVASLHATRKHPDSYSEDIVTLGHKFASHAFELLESEKGVKSLTLLQGAAVLWLFASNEGSRSSRTQCASLESLLRDTWLALGLETGGSALFKFSGKDDAHDVRIWQAVSHITWGFYCFFAKMAMIFSPDMLVSRPLIMKTFEDLEAQRGSGSPASVSSSGEDSIANQTSYQLQVFSAKCSLCEIADQFMSMFVNNGQMLLLDSGHCTALYNKLLCWKLSLPDHLMTSNSVSSSLLLLQATYDFVALKLLFSYTSHAGTDLFDGRNAASLQVLHASSMITNLWIYRGIYTIKHEYWAAEYCSFVAHALLPRLESDASAPAVQDIIGRACCVLNEMALAGVSGRAQELLAGVEERARSFKMRVPSYGRKSATHESATPMVLIRGVQVFDGARGSMLDPENGTHAVSFGETIEHVRPESPGGGQGGGGG
ncbi:C6 transcription factor [Colletotrichum tofieldiae]|uniref:C6 transcription factor n=1 Tax=Colletotrichum tofieldiae TaxID=708197 RepID=A0A166N6K3_9PEZI|nr:C6 transcription factor [Colletotrichum tofieldiae]